MPANGPKGRPDVRETAQMAMVPREAAAPTTARARLGRPSTRDAQTIWNAPSPMKKTAAIR